MWGEGGDGSEARYHCHECGTVFEGCGEALEGLARVTEYLHVCIECGYDKLAKVSEPTDKCKKCESYSWEISVFGVEIEDDWGVDRGCE